MGGFSGGGNPLMEVGAKALDMYTKVPVASTVLSMAQMNAQQQAQSQAAQQGYDREAELLRRQESRAVQEKRDLLRRATASQRARLGAMGVGGGSADALIHGMQRQNAVELSDIQSAFDDRRSLLDWNFQTQLKASRQQQWMSQLSPILSDMLMPQQKEAKEPQGYGYVPARSKAGFNLL